jgi:hypothetical protein
LTCCCCCFVNSRVDGITILKLLIVLEKQHDVELVIVAASTGVAVVSTTLMLMIYNAFVPKHYPHHHYTYKIQRIEILLCVHPSIIVADGIVADYVVSTSGSSLVSVTISIF